MLKTSTYFSLVAVAVAVAPDSSKNIGPMMPLAEIAAHTVDFGECRGMVAILLGLEVLQKTFVFELTFSLR